MSFQMVNIEDQLGEQVIKIPKHLKIDGDKVYLKRMGKNLYIIPCNDPWESLENSVNDFSEDYMSDRNQPESQNRESVD